MQDIYNHIIPEDQLDCLKYYVDRKVGRKCDSRVIDDDDIENDDNNIDSDDCMMITH